MIKQLIAFFVRLLLKIRYRVRIVGLEHVKSGSGLFVLPNHPALIDPVILVSHFYPYVELHPLILESFFKLKGFSWIIKMLDAIPIPSMEGELSAYRRRKVLKSLQAVSTTLNSNANVLMYPSGRLMSSSYEKLRGNTGLWQILKETNQPHVVLVRTSGLYGSIFSKALTGGTTPSFVEALTKGIKIAFSNLVFFVPKREVIIEIEPAPSDFFEHKDALSQNRWLEHWYNKNSLEVSLLPYYFWCSSLPELPSSNPADDEIENLSPEIVAKVRQKLSEMSNLDVSKISLQSKLSDDIGLDSLSVADLLMWLDSEFSVGDIDISQIVTVSSLVKAAMGIVETKELEAEQEEIPSAWLDTESRKMPKLAEGRVIPELFLNSANINISSTCCADAISGVWNWSKVKFVSLLMANKMRSLCYSETVGVLLPASVLTTVTLVALLIAGKVPVMINWTTGRRNIEHALKLANVDIILTSESFLDQVVDDLEYLENRFVFLESLKNVSWLSLIRAYFLSKLSAERILRLFEISSDPERTAVILFTSGSESVPKGVPLSHKNIISNIKSTLDVFTLSKEDVMYSFLPPFHSFGLTVTMLLPLFAGARVFFSANPNESKKIAQNCSRWSVTLLAGTPTFLRSIIKAASKKSLNTIRLFLSGAEAVPESLVSEISDINPQAQLVEGYGITECSPIVSATRLGEKRIGVGRPLSCVEVLIVDIDTHCPLTEGCRGLILIRGDSVFRGYLSGQPNPFIRVNNKLWYNSGDLGFLKDGSLVISGRIKRFTKIAGEMISLPALESALNAVYGAKDEEIGFCVLAKESSDGTRPQLFLFSTNEINVEDVNKALASSGFSHLVKIRDVIVIPNIPLLGSGKTDYQKLHEILDEKPIKDVSIL